MKHASTILALVGLGVVIYAMRHQKASAESPTEGSTFTTAVPKGKMNIGVEGLATAINSPPASPSAVPEATPSAPTINSSPVGVPPSMALGRRFSHDEPALVGSSFLREFKLA